MEKQSKIAYGQLKVHFKLSCQSYRIKPAMIADYLKAVNKDGGRIIQGKTSLVIPKSD
jgi:hypothetical protein